MGYLEKIFRGFRLLAQLGQYTAYLIFFGLSVTLFPLGASAAVETIEAQVNSSTDDAEQENASVSLTSSDLELTVDKEINQTVGIRFNDINLPKGVEVSNAYIQFQVDEVSSSATTLAIQGEAVDNAQTFSSTLNDITSRALTAETVFWTPAAWPVAGVAGIDQRSPDISAIIQEIIDRENWVAGNSLAIIISGDGNGKRVAESYNGDPGGAPVLHIEYGATPGNEAPTASAGPDRSIIFPTDTLCLTGTANDDGIPGELSVNWLQQSGPGAVVIETPSAYSTSATFPVSGSYSMAFQASDSELTTTDVLLVTVGRRINVPGDAVSIAVFHCRAGRGFQERSTVFAARNR